MNSSNMKTVECSVNPEAVQWEQQKWIRGGVGCSGIVATVCASVMNKDQSLIVTSIYVRLYQILRQIGKDDTSFITWDLNQYLNTFLSSHKFQTEL